ncbi:unnamed protein product [Symbiodinium sp. CCMP2592]|nr:unnamed protein product [Symbiodinium sp. CCMP2592]
MTALPGIKVGLLGVPDGPDLDLDDDASHKAKGLEGRQDSPAKRTKAAPSVEGITMEAIRGLLQEQSFQLLQAQQAQISSSLTAFEERQAARLDLIESTVQSQGAEVQGVQGQLRDLAARVSQLETQGPGASTSGPDRRHTLVFGGWAANTRKATLLHQLRQALSALKLESHLDSEPFCTGARRSVALCQFRKRATEDESQPRSRMMEVIQVVNGSKVSLEGADRPLWCSFSKTPQERGKAALAAAVRKVVQRHAVHRMEELDVEYPTGRTWLREDQLSGLGEAPPDVRHPKQVETRAGMGWIDERTLSRWVEKDLSEVVFAGDINTGFGWAKDGAEITAVAREGKGNIFHKVLAERGMSFGTPSESQLSTPTSRPRAANREGQCIDVLAYSALRFDSWHVHEDSHMHIGTDHELCEGRGYRDSDEVKQAFRAAKRAGTAASWKERWDVGFAEAQHGDPHEAVHTHLSEVYKGNELPEYDMWTGEVTLFTTAELRTGVAQLKKGKAVGSDLTSTELVLGIMETPGGEEHLLAWYNSILTSQKIPAKWNEPVMVMLPKIRAPRKAKELRPIAMGSAVSKLFSRLLLNRALPCISPQTYAQCSGPGRQTADFLYTIIRLFELTREWGNPLVIFKLDLEKAFDSLDRGSLLARLESRIGQGAELNCWKGLLRGTTGLLQTPWGSSRVAMTRGIKQGAVESPTFFAYVAELALADVIEVHRWREMPPLFPDLPPEEMLYMDDGMVWNGLISVVQTRAQRMSVEFAKYGLKMNPTKCQLYASSKVEGEHSIILDGVKVEAGSQLEVMGLTLRVGMSVYELISPATTRARSKFWELRHIFRAKGNMKERARVLQRVVGATALWFICAVPPDKAGMTAMNATQLQLMGWRGGVRCGFADIGDLRGIESELLLLQSRLSQHPLLAAMAALRILRVWALWAAHCQAAPKDGEGSHVAHPTSATSFRMAMSNSNNDVTQGGQHLAAHGLPPHPELGNDSGPADHDRRELHPVGISDNTILRAERAAIREKISMAISNRECQWKQSAKARLQQLRAQGGGQEPVWLGVLRRIQHRGHELYRQWCRQYLQDLRQEFSSSLHYERYTAPLTPSEVAWAADIEFACFQDFLDSGLQAGECPRGVIRHMTEDSRVLAELAAPASSSSSSDFPYGLFHATWVDPATGTWGTTAQPGPGSSAETAGMGAWPNEGETPAEHGRAEEMSDETGLFSTSVTLALLASRVDEAFGGAGNPPFIMDTCRQLREHTPALSDPVFRRMGTPRMEELEGRVQWVLETFFHRWQWTVQPAHMQAEEVRQILEEYTRARQECDRLEWGTRASASSTGRDGSRTPRRGSSNVASDRSRENTLDEEVDETHLFQLPPGLAQQWEDLMERFWGWFEEGRAVGITIMMIRGIVRDRVDSQYQNWANRPLETLSVGIPNSAGVDTEVSPLDFRNWAEAAERVLHLCYVQDRDRGSLQLPVVEDEVSLMDNRRAARSDEYVTVRLDEAPAPTEPASGSRDGHLLFDRNTFDYNPTGRARVPTSFLPTSTLRNVSAMHEGMCPANRLTSTVAFVTVLRYLMSEVSLTLDTAEAIARTGEGTQEAEELEGEDGDSTNLMQRSLSSMFAPGHSQRWARAMVRLQKELSGQGKAKRVQHLRRLRQGLAGCADPRGEWCEQMEAMLLAMQPSDFEGDDSGCDAVDTQWLSGWYGELGVLLQGYGMPVPVDTQTGSLNDTVAPGVTGPIEGGVDLDQLLQDEQEARDDRELMERELRERESLEAEHDLLCEQEARLLQEQARDLQREEDQQMQEEMRRPTKRQCVITIELASGSGDRARTLHTLSAEVPEDGTALHMTLRAAYQADPDEVTTVGVPSPGHGEQGSGAVGSHDSMGAQQSSQPNLLSHLEFDEYEALYAEWRAGRTSSGTIERMYGKDVLELLEAQQMMARDDETQVEEVIPQSPAMRAGQPRIRFCLFESIFGQWKAGWRSDRSIRDGFNAYWLQLFYLWRGWGPESIEPYLASELDMRSDPSPGEPCPLIPDAPMERDPPRVPMSCVMVTFVDWCRGELTDSQIRDRQGLEWLSRFKQLRESGLRQVATVLGSEVLWDVSEEYVQAQSELLSQWAGLQGPTEQGTVLDSSLETAVQQESQETHENRQQSESSDVRSERDEA